jgi:hypothetical protein
MSQFMPKEYYEIDPIISPIPFWFSTKLFHAYKHPVAKMIKLLQSQFTRGPTNNKAK